MSVALAVFTSDPNLLACELMRLDGKVGLANRVPTNAVGVGMYAQEDVLLRRFSTASSRLSPVRLAEEAQSQSEALLYHARALPVGTSLEENTQPFRYRRWMFCHNGQIERFAEIRPRLLSLLPDYLRRTVHGDTDSEVAFALFLKSLRDVGRFEDAAIEAALVAQLVGKTVRLLEQTSAENGGARAATLNFIVTNGRLLVATRHGELPLFYTLLEGSARCDRCKIDASTRETDPRVRAHRRRKTVVIASHVVQTEGWLEISNETAIAVGRDLSIQQLPI